MNYKSSSKSERIAHSWMRSKEKCLKISSETITYYIVIIRYYIGQRRYILYGMILSVLCTRDFLAYFS